MPWRLLYTKPAERDIFSIPEKEQQNIAHLLEKLQIDPGSVDIKKMAGKENRWRLRAGKWRIILQFDNQAGIIGILRIQPRMDAYRG